MTLFIRIRNKSMHFHFLVFFLLTVAAIVAYSNSFYAAMTFDDHEHIINNQYIKINNLSINNLIDAALNSPMHFRGLPYLTFAVNHAVHGLDVFGYHAINLAIHAMTGFLLYLLALTTLTLPGMLPSCKRPKEIAVAAALLWLVHPIQTSAVTYIVQRMTSLAALFSFCTLLCYIHGRQAGTNNQRILYFAGAIISAIFALFSKETSAVLPLLILGYELFFLRSINWRQDGCKIWTTIGLASIIFLLFAWLYLGSDPLSAILSGYERRDFTINERLLTEPRVIMHYLTLMLLPLPELLNLTHDFSISQTLISPPQTILAILALVGMIAAIPLCYQRYRLLSFALFWFLINLAIESTIIPLELIFEHRLYLPTAFLFIVSVYYLAKATDRWPAIFRTILIILAATLALLTWMRNKDWQTEITIWTDATQKSPNLARGYVNLGKAESERGNVQIALRHFEKAIALEPQKGAAYYNLGLAYDRMNRPAEALNALLAALDKKEVNLARIHDGLGIAYRKMKNFEKAIAEAQTALNLDPDLLEAYVTIGISLEDMGQSDKALAIFQLAAAKGLDSVDLHNNWAKSLATFDKFEQAITHLKHAIAIAPNHFESNYNLGVMYSRLGMIAEAEQHISRALALKNAER